MNKEAVEHLLSSEGSSTLFSINDQITKAIHACELRYIAKALNAEVGDLTNFSPLAKGMTNRSNLFSCKNEQYILLIYFFFVHDGNKHDYGNDRCNKQRYPNHEM